AIIGPGVSLSRKPPPECLSLQLCARGIWGRLSNAVLFCVALSRGLLRSTGLAVRLHRFQRQRVDALCEAHQIGERAGAPPGREFIAQKIEHALFDKMEFS